MITTNHRYVVRDEAIMGGEPIIEGTRTPVRAIVELWRQGILPEEIPSQLSHLSLAQVFDALSYYSDHQGEINEYIATNRSPDELIHPLLRDE
jgi:uncharacterized protein (DUF433 family)